MSAVRGAKTAKCHDEVTVIYKEIVAGVTKSEIMRKLIDGEYDCVDSYGKSRQWRYNLFNNAMERFKIDNEGEVREFRERIATRYEEIYRRAMERNNFNAANTAMANLSKLLGTDAPEKISFDDININLV